ncbi:hypothetical protein BD289DRAFT_367346 [Coniella lustricola]|uniref:Nuclear distribution protein n=1 Tax=Coniella lustricola TaxID=2025994 RepID=A0A2T3A9K5_9PEZI|nr:hypothetical protein BD289DRAFT_367346 [Coniella lustricola]
MDDSSLDKTAISTIGLLEARLLRIEQLLYGTTSQPTPQPPAESVSGSLAGLERRFANIVTRFRVYGDILKLYRSHPAFFSPAPDPAQPPSQLDTSALRATVLSFASSFPSTVSALTAATADTPIPDPALSAELVNLLPKMKGIEATQLAQEAEIAELRARSENVVGTWYEQRVVGYGAFVAEVEGKIERIERDVRRVEAAKQREEV